MNFQFPPYINKEKLNHFIDEALKEDVGDGDHSSLSTIPKELQNRAHLLVKDEGVLAGVDLAKYIFTYYDPALKVDLLLKDGDRVKYGDIAFTVKGSAQSILTTERLILNCMQRMTGIATYTKSMSDLIAHLPTKLLDTRKTTPNFRMLEKWAVLIGGGHNHRFGLYDMIMLKDNHIDYAGGITKAVRATKSYLKEKGKDLKIEVETRNLEEVKEALAVGVDRIMLDNMSPALMKEAVALIKGQTKTEASGGITETTIAAAAESGVDYISVGALIHSAKNKDLSLKAY